MVCLRAVTRGTSDPSKASAAASDPTTSGDPAEKLGKQHAEFGPLSDPSHLYTSGLAGSAMPDPVVDDPPYRIILTTYISFLVVIFLGHIQDFSPSGSTQAHISILGLKTGTLRSIMTLRASIPGG
jgi:serine palmitoyltransferase